MNHYTVYGNTIATDLLFPQLIPCIAQTADIVIRQGVIPDHILAEAEHSAYAFGSSESYLVNKTCYLYVENGRTITYRTKPGANENYLKTYILGYGIAMLFLQMDHLAIHCSAVSDAKGAILICGESGCGKSTVTTHLLERGYTLMADDMAVLAHNKEGKAMVMPAFPYQKLCRDVVEQQKLDQSKLLYINEEKDKFLVPYQGSFFTHPVLLRGIILLSLSGRENDVLCRPLTGIDTFHAYTENLFLRHLLAEKKYQVPVGPLCLSFANAVPIWNITRPVQKDTLTQVLSCVDHIAASL